MGAFWVHTDLSVLWHQCEFPHFTQCCCSWAFMSPAQSSLRHPPNPHFIFSWFSTCISHFHLLYFSFPPSWYFQRHIFQLCWPIVQYLLMPDSEIRSSWVGLVWGGGTMAHYCTFWGGIAPEQCCRYQQKALYLIIFGGTAVQCNWWTRAEKHFCDPQLQASTKPNQVK